MSDLRTAGVNLTYSEYHQNSDTSSFQQLALRAKSRTGTCLDVLSISALNYDYIYSVDRIEPDHEVASYNTTSAAGGSGANSAVALSLLGASTAIAGIVGDDEKGRLLRQSLEQAGVDSSQIITNMRTDGTTGEAIVFAARVRNGGRMIVVSPGVNNNFAATVRSSGKLASLQDAAASARIVHLSSFAGSGERELQKKIVNSLPDDAVVSLNPGQLYALLGVEEVAPLLARADIVFFYEAHLDALIGASEPTLVMGTGEWLTERLRRLGEKLQRLEGRSPSVFVIKRSWASDEAHFLVISDRRGERHHYCSARVGAGVNTTVDATGAGDAMAAGTLFALLRGVETRDAVDFAYLMAMCASTKLGARAGLPVWAEIEERWREHMHGLREPPSELIDAVSP